MSDGTADTIYALSSGSPPAAIAIVRISGPAADEALRQLIGRLPAPRVATLASLRDPRSDELLDRALVLRLPGPASATGEDVAELHLHGGRAVVAAVFDALASLPALRSAEAGEFTRRAFLNGTIDLAEAEGLADLLTAETESQRRAAMTLAGGMLSRKVADWQERMLSLSARVEALLDFSDEGDVEEKLPPEWVSETEVLTKEVAEWSSFPSSERLRNGIRVVIAGPPNSGKSTLFNALARREAAITSPIAGTTRDIIEAPATIAGIPVVLVDTAGLRDSGDAIEVIGIGRARAMVDQAEILFWLGSKDALPDRSGAILVEPKADIRKDTNSGAIRVSALTGLGLKELIAALQHEAARLLPRADQIAVNQRHHTLLRQAANALDDAAATGDLVIKAETFRLARYAFDQITGRAGIENMLDQLFSNFCIGK